MNEKFIGSETYNAVTGPYGTDVTIIVINEGYEIVELVTRDSLPDFTESGVSLTTKHGNYAEAIVTLSAGDTLYAKVRRDQIGRIFYGEQV